MSTLRDILLHPRRAAEHLRAQPRWLGPFVIVAFLTIGLYALGFEVHSAEVLRHLPASADDAARQQVRESLRGDLWRECLFLPYRLALGWGGFAAILFLSGRAFTRDKSIQFRHVLALEIHAELILLFPTLALLAGIPIPSLALALAGETADFVPTSLLRAANCFTLWYVLALSVGMAVLFRLRARTAILIVAVCWGLTEFFNAGVLSLLIRSFHFHL
jgi:hypothetical protein